MESRRHASCSSKDAILLPLSFQQLSELPGVNASAAELRGLAQEFFDRWGFRVRIQKRRKAKV
jgi:hypothetical protein